MHSARAATTDPGTTKGSWNEIFRDGLGLFSALVIGGIAMNATQMLVIAIITSDEHRTTAAALTSMRSNGTAFGAAIAGAVANIAGLGDATESGAVGHAVTALYMFWRIPFGLAVLFMFRFVRISLGKPDAVSVRGGYTDVEPPPVMRSLRGHHQPPPDRPIAALPRIAAG